MTIRPAGTDNTNVPPQNYGGVSQEQVEDFKEVVSHSTTSSNASGMQSSKGEHTSEHSQDTSKSLPYVLATRPPINLGSPTGKQGAPLYDTQGKGSKAGSETRGNNPHSSENATKPVRVADNDQPNTRTRTTGSGAGGTGHGSGGTSGSGGTGGTSGTGGHGTGGPPGVAAGVAAGAVGGAVGAAGTHGTKEVETKNHGGEAKTVKLKDFKPPGWEDAAGNPEACYKLACSGASQTAPAGQSVTGGGGIILYDDKTGLGSEIIKRPAQRIHTDKDASAVALEQIKRHIDDGRAVVAGVSEPASSEIVDGPKIENGKEKPGKQPVTNHYVAVYGYETDAKGKIVGLYAKDNAVPGAPDIFFKVGADGSITKPEDPQAPSKYMKQEYQLSEVKFHEGFEYKGELRPKNDDGNVMFWPHP